MTSFSHIAFVTGLAGVCAVVLLTVIGGAAFPGYSHAGQRRRMW